MPIFLAIDAGGTKTECLLADDTRILARASTGTIKLMRVSEAEATARLHAVLAEVAACAGVSLADITRTCIGLAGVSIPAVRAWATDAMIAKVSGELILCGDDEIALEAAFSGGPGILVIAGTGSKAIGRATDGTMLSGGGWGSMLGDEGSGFWIGLESIRAALRGRVRDGGQISTMSREDPRLTSNAAVLRSGVPSERTSFPAAGWAGGTPSTDLLLEIRRHWKLDSLGDLVAFANHRGDARQSAPDFSTLAPIVARSAEQGNLVAADTLRRAGEHLADLVTLVFENMTVTSTQGQSHNLEQARGVALESRSRAVSETYGPAISVAFTGSVLSRIIPVRDAMIARLALTLPSGKVQASAAVPLEGALWRARHAADRAQSSS